MRLRGLLAPLAIAGALLTSTAYAQDVPALANAPDDTERARIQGLIDAAKQEGKLEWVGGFISAESGAKILESFKAYYGLDDFTVEHTFAGTGELITRVDQLLNAKSNNFDIVWTASWGWYKDLLKRGELMEYRSPNYAAYTLSDKAGMSQDGYWVSDGYSNSPMFNTEALKNAGIDFNGESWAEMLDPKVKGLISIPDPLTSASGAQTYIGMVKVMGPEWVAKLVANEPVRRAQAVQATGWLATGEIPITFSHARETYGLKKRGVPVKLTYPKEGVVMQPFAAVILQSAPHPNAAKLFIDFVRSADGAQAVQDAGSLMFFGRPGVKSPDPEILPGWEDITVVPMNWDEDAGPEDIEAVRKLFRDAGMN
jgi:iron(III) transport system substrate-binding protein